MTVITVEELQSFHSIDRELFVNLVIKCRRDPREALVVMALWLWLEEEGYPNLIQSLLSLSDLSTVHLVYAEASSCLRSMECSNGVNEGEGLPLTGTLLGRHIPVSMFSKNNRCAAIGGVRRFLNNVCMLVFADILGWCMLQGEEEEGEEERTMFLTFSRGFPVSEGEVEDLFRRLYGDCVEGIEMETGGGGQQQQQQQQQQQPLYGRMLLRSSASIHRILNGRSVSKFRINGKHIWARRYERRDPG